jgi:hypothetical protein
MPRRSAIHAAFTARWRNKTHEMAVRFRAEMCAASQRPPKDGDGAFTRCPACGQNRRRAAVLLRQRKLTESCHHVSSCRPAEQHRRVQNESLVIGVTRSRQTGPRWRYGGKDFGGRPGFSGEHPIRLTGRLGWRPLRNRCALAQSDYRRSRNPGFGVLPALAAVFVH